MLSCIVNKTTSLYANASTTLDGGIAYRVSLYLVVFQGIILTRIFFSHDKRL